MRTIDEVIEEVGREVGRRLRGCTLSHDQYERLLAIIREDVWPAVHCGFTRKDEDYSGPKAGPSNS